MRPSFANTNIANSSVADRGARRNLVQGVTLSTQLTDHEHVYFSYLMRTLPLSVYVIVASLIEHIVDIIKISADKQVSGVAAGWVITTVKNKQAFRNGAIHQLISHLVRLASFIPEGKSPITEGIPICHPKPAYVDMWVKRLLHLCPEQSGAIKRNVTHFLSMRVNVTAGITSNSSRSFISLPSNRGGFTTTTTAQPYRMAVNVIGNLCYNLHVTDLLNRLVATPRPFIAALGFTVPIIPREGYARG